MAAILEAIMLICFGLSWPINAYKLWKARTAAGTSWQFMTLISVGYCAGIAAKFASGELNWVLAVYFLNLVFLAVNWGVYFRNLKFDRAMRGVAHASRPYGIVRDGKVEAGGAHAVPRGSARAVAYGHSSVR